MFNSRKTTISWKMLKSLEKQGFLAPPGMAKNFGIALALPNKALAKLKCHPLQLTMRPQTLKSLEKRGFLAPPGMAKDFGIALALPNKALAK